MWKVVALKRARDETALASPEGGEGRGAETEAVFGGGMVMSHWIL